VNVTRSDKEKRMEKPSTPLVFSNSIGPSSTIKARNYVLLAMNSEGFCIGMKILGQTYASQIEDHKNEIRANVKRLFPREAEKPIQFRIADFNNPTKNSMPQIIEHNV